MTIQEVLSEVDGLKPNEYTDAEKIKWLDHIERTLYLELFALREGDPTETTEINDDNEETTTSGFSGYTEDTDQDTELLVPEPYSDLYKHYIMAQIDYSQAEYERYAASSSMFNNAYQNFVNYWIRNHKPKKNAYLKL